MKKSINQYKLFLFIGIFSAGMLFPLYVKAELVIYDATVSWMGSKSNKCTLNGQNTFIYGGAAGSTYLQFSFSGSVDVVYDFGIPFTKVDVRPKSKVCNVVVSGTKVKFTLTKPCNLSIEFDGNSAKPFFLFASPLETNIPDPNDPNVIYYGPGFYDLSSTNAIQLTGGKTLYIAGGAFLYKMKGTIAIGGDNNKIMGRGVIDLGFPNNICTFWWSGATNSLLEGIVINRYSTQWNNIINQSSHCTLDNIKVISDDNTDDGTDLDGSQNITIKNCFYRVKDDCIAIYGRDYGGQKDVKNIMISQCTFFNGVWGNAVRVGHESDCNYIRDIFIEDCDVIHTQGLNNNEGIFDFSTGGRGNIVNIKVENIRVEESTDNIVVVRVFDFLQKSTTRGTVDSIYFKNIYITEGVANPPAIIQGWDATHKVTNITFEGLVYNGHTIMGPNDSCHFNINTYTGNITFKPSGAPYVSATGVSINPLSANLSLNATLQLTATVTPLSASNKNIIWSSMNTSVATVNNMGVVTGIATGTTTITATTQDGCGKTATCPIIVDATTRIIQYSVSEFIKIFPNPAGTSAIINYQLNANSELKIIILDVMGKEIIQIANEYQSAGEHQLNLNTLLLPNGIYFVKMNVSDSNILIKKFSVNNSH